MGGGSRLQSGRFQPSRLGFRRPFALRHPYQLTRPSPRRPPIRFSAPVSQPAADRQRARETEYDQLQTEIERLARPDWQVPDR
jgi:hypothetical protein